MSSSICPGSSSTTLLGCEPVNVWSSFVRFGVAGLMLAAPVVGQTVPQGPRVCAGGDVLLGSNLDTTWAPRAAARLGRSVEATPDPEWLIEPLMPLVGDADIALLNVEGAIGIGASPRKCRPGSTSCYAFRQPPEAAAAYRGVHPTGWVLGNVANNHAMDSGAEGFAETQELLTDAGVFVTGVDSLPALIPHWKGTVAVLGFSTAQAGPDPRDLDAVREYVRRAEAQARWVVVTMHMGAEGAGAQRTRDTTEIFLGENRGNVVAFARAAVEAGADLVVGHGPHVLRAMEWYQGAFIAYSLGNLLTYGPFNMGEPRNRGAILCATLAERGVERVTLRSTLQQSPGTVGPDPSARAVALVDSLSRLDFPESRAQFTSGGTAIRP